MPTSLVFDAENVKQAMSNWLPKLVPLTEQMSRKIDGQSIENAAATFIVAKSFSKRRENIRSMDFDCIVTPLRRAVDSLTDENLIDRVNGLADELVAIPGLVKLGRGGSAAVRPISAASKFVWTARPEVGVIYDRRAQTCIGRKYPDAWPRTYSSYVHAVRQEQPLHAKFIESLVSHAGPALAKTPWLRDKIFDFCLYAHG